MGIVQSLESDSRRRTKGAETLPRCFAEFILAYKIETEMEEDL